MRDIKIKDRDVGIERKRMALNMIGVGVDYKTTLLIEITMLELKKKKGGFSLEDAAKIESDWAKRMEDYFEEK